MKKALLLLVICLFPVFTVLASETRNSPLKELAALGNASSLPDLSGAVPSGFNSYPRGAAAGGAVRRSGSRETSLGDLVIIEDQLASNEDFELTLPEGPLPDSDIPLTLNGQVEYFIRYFQTSGRKSFTRWLSRSERYIPMMKEVLKKNGLPEDLVYLAMIESGFTPHAVSVASAVGPWQFISGTGKRYDLRIDQWIDERRDPLKSTVAAALYLKELYAMFNNDWYLAAAGYNAGENKILRAIDRYNTRDFWEISKGSYLKRETKEYVPKLLAAAIIAKEPTRYGFADVAYLPPIEFDTVTIPSRTDLEVAAKLCNVDYQVVKELNPELRRWCTPPDYPGYELKIPFGKKRAFEQAYAQLPEGQRYAERFVYARYRAKKRDTLASIASRYGTTPQALAEVNKLKLSAKVRGRTLLVPVVADKEPAVQTAKADAPRKESAKGFNKYYTVKKGDTIASLSKKFNISSRILTAWNNLKGKLALRPGKRIIVAKYVEKKGSMVPVSGGDDNG
ncbi:lytic transglycosylase domain-containing protein [Geobacter grbiciae]|uniref:lytic transglycosylase domain-containing protein n=1 Tax=Geobacter grbiciae TaxID=155042 RepID=UPI001C0229EA|nr:lytic transglycosylase domain-containing protein [Geobacter grbiciae]MBT1075724.1 transglycosylase SLT domain-containing protein [Geobacter grbiciae]